VSEDFAQPETPFAEDAMEGFVGPDRRRMPDDRLGVTCKFSIGGHEGYVTLNAFEENGELGEMFLHGIGKDGSALRGFADAFAIMFSIALQYGAPLDMIARKLAHMRFDPQGKTDHPPSPRRSRFLTT
jgi:ribonucleoside-diphosphate reductase alpha chain